MSRKPFDLIGLGECMVELYADQPLGVTRTLTKSYGGDVLNALVTASRLGSRTGFISRVGDDPFGQGLLEAWQSEGVDVSQAPLVEGENGVYFISLLEGGEREFTYRRAGSAASQIRPQDLSPDYLASGKLLLVSGISQAISASAQATVLEAARIAKAGGARVAYDPNYRPRLWAARGGLEAAQGALEEILPLADVLLPSYPADAVLLGEFDSLTAALAAFAERAPLVALKAAEQGAWLAGWGEVAHIAACPARVVDSTGAGDAWNGAFLHEYGQGDSPLEAAQTANAVAAAKLAHRGAVPPLSALEELVIRTK